MDNQQRLASSSVLVNLLVLLSVKVLYVSTTSLSFNFVDNQQLLTVSFFRDFGACQQLHDSSFFDHLSPAWATTNTQSFMMRHSLITFVQYHWNQKLHGASFFGWFCVLILVTNNFTVRHSLVTFWTTADTQSVMVRHSKFLWLLSWTPTDTNSFTVRHSFPYDYFHGLPYANSFNERHSLTFFIEYYANGFQMCHSLITFVDYRW